MLGKGDVMSEEIKVRTESLTKEKIKQDIKESEFQINRYNGLLSPLLKEKKYHKTDIRFYRNIIEIHKEFLVARETKLKETL